MNVIINVIGVIVVIVVSVEFVEEDIISPFPFVVVVIYTIITFTFIIVLVGNAFIMGSKIDNYVDFVDNCIDLATFNIMGVANAYFYCNFIVSFVLIVLKNHNLNATVVITKEIVVTKVDYINP